jgi:glycosyltransferase involved in cell wall biosynthesis
MSRIFLVGQNPPPLLKRAKIEAANYRTWQFLQPLLDDGHQVCLCSDNPDEFQSLNSVPKEWSRKVAVQLIPFGRRGWRRIFQEAHDAFSPDCVVAIDFYHCLYATRLKTSVPLWMDIYGDLLTIVQAACYRAQSNRGIPTSIAYLRQVLQSGDVFSVCSTPQKHALVGELAMTGRLNHQTFGYDFVRAVLPGSPPPGSDRLRHNEGRPLLSRSGAAADDFVVLWCGGYNTWTDVETLFAGLEWAMAREPRIRFVSVGGSTYCAGDDVYNRFLEKIEKSSFRDRFCMLGWRPWAEIAVYYAESDLGLNIDSIHYETIYGTRTRLVEMLAAGLPTLTTLGTELSHILQENGSTLGFEPGDWRQLGEAIISLSKDPATLQTMSQSALTTANGLLSFSNTTFPLHQWVHNPRHAPDRVKRGAKEKIHDLDCQGHALVRQVLWEVAGLDK